MKVILSRKGYDDKYGGGCSPIMPDGRLLSIPIPKGKEDNYGIPYETILIDKDRNCRDLMRDIGLKITNEEAHLDPDIRKSALQRENGWRGIFGQDSAAQGHLRIQGVDKGDLFLFFGSFKEADNFNKALPRHIIFGYLLIGEKFPITDREKFLKDNANKRWALKHPHIENEYHQNTVYMAADYLDDTKTYSGYGVFYFNDNLVLTRKRQEHKSRWELESFFHKDNGCLISRHGRESRWGIENGRTILDTVGLGQEFVIQDNKYIEKWALDLIRGSKTYQ